MILNKAKKNDLHFLYKIYNNNFFKVSLPIKEIKAVLT